MNRDSAKHPSVSNVEHAEVIVNLAKNRIAIIQNAAADLFAYSLSACMEHDPSLTENLWEAQDIFFSKIHSHIPITIDTGSRENIERTRSVDLSQNHLIIIANHPPFEKTVSPTETQFRDALHAIHKHYLVDQIDNTKNLPAGIMRRAVIDSIIRSIYPGVQFQHHVVGGRYRPPLNIVQEHDGTIIVPYANEETNGFDMLLNGLTRVFRYTHDLRVHTVVTFPEGEQPRVIEELKPFHTGIFAAAQKLTAEKHIPVTLLPVVMAVAADFSVHSRVLTPIQSILHEQEAHLASTLQREFQQEYLSMLQSMPDGYYWQGMTYPYGGISRSDILSIPKK